MKKQMINIKKEPKRKENNMKDLHRNLLTYVIILIIILVINFVWDSYSLSLLQKEPPLTNPDYEKLVKHTTIKSLVSHVLSASVILMMYIYSGEKIDKNNMTSRGGNTYMNYEDIGDFSRRS